MKNAYKIIVNNAQGSAKTLTHDVPAPGSFWGPLKIKANPGARYQLVDVNTGQGPDNIRVKRVGKDLRISFEGRDTVDVMITDYYEHAGNESLVGEVEAGVLHAYVPESGESTQMLSRLADGAKSTGMALGSEQLAGSGAAVGALVAAAGFNPLLAAPLALLGAGGGGGAGAGAAAATPKPNATATVDITGMMTDSGVSGADFITNDKSLTYSGTVSNFTANGDKVKVELLDATGTTVDTAYVDVTGASSTSAGAGTWSWTRSTEHADGQYSLRATIVDTAGNRTNATAPTNGTGGGQDTQVVIVDTSGGTVQPSGLADPNITATIDIVAITDDSGVSGADFITNDKSLTYSGTVSNFTANGDKVKVELLNATGTTVLETAYVDVTGASSTTAGAGTWSWTRSTEHADGQYSLRATIVDTAGNRTNATAPTNGTGGGQDTQVVIVDTSSNDNYNPAKVADPNKGLAVQIVSIDADTGVSATDFVTSDNTLTFKGTVANTFVKNGDFVELQLLDSAGKVVASQYVEPVNDSGQWRWTWDNSKQTLADGTYKLTALVVDKAGNAVGAGPLEQAITIDTNATPDSNSNFSIKDIKLNQDSGSSSSDFLTNKQALSFTGKLDGSIKDFSGKVLVQVVGMDGKVISQSYVTPEQDGTWLYDNTKQNLGFSDKNTQYLLNASVVDLAGNILKSTDQSFTVDLLDPVFTRSAGTTSGGASYLFSQSSPLILEAGQKLSNGTFSAAEVGAFTFLNAQNQPVNAPNPSPDGPALSYDPNSLKIVYTDLAGNIFSMTNDKIWIFSAGVTISNVQLSSSTPSTFGNGELAGSIGSYILGPNEMALDLSTLHSTSPQVGDHAAINHISLSGGGINNVANADHVLTLTTSDVLALGVKNSFVSNGRQQIRIDGDTDDKVILDDLLGGSEYPWSVASTPQALNSANYRAYTNTDLGIDLFIQQGIQIQTPSVL